MLDDHGIDRAGIERQALVELMDRLGGHPLSLNLVLPHLRRYTPAELTARFEELLPGFATGAARERDESLAVSLEFSLRRLGEETRAALPDLAVFQGAAFEDDLLAITEIDPELWRAARAEMKAAALVRAKTIPGVIPPILRFHPTLLPYLARGLPGDRRAGLEARYRQQYYDLADYLYHADTQTPHQARAVAQRELPNLRRALELAVEAGAVEEAADLATSLALFLDVFGRRRERDMLLARVVGMQGGGPPEGEGLSRVECLLQGQRGEVLLQQGRLAEAEAVFRDLLARLEAGAAYSGDEAAYHHALTLAWLGRCLADRGRPEQAVDRHRRALAELERLGESDEQAKEMSGKVYTDLADSLAALGRLDEAQHAYESGLRISRGANDLRSVSVKLVQLGTLALRRGDPAEARRRYREALETFRALGEPEGESVAWHQLGRVAEEARDWDEAERCYREAVRICEQLRDWPQLSKSYNQLGLVAKAAGRPDDAERWYLRAQEINDRVSPHDASTLGNLAALYLDQGRLEEAERYARRAVAIVVQLDLSAEPWKKYAILAAIAEARERAGEAAEWRRKANESRDAFAGTQHHLAPILQQFQPVIAAVVAACEGDAQSRAQAEGAFGAFERGNWRIVDAIRRIWAGERDPEALTAGIDYNSRAIVLAILVRLLGEEPPAPPDPASRGAAETGPGRPAAAPSAGAGAAAPQLSPEAAHLLEQWAPVIGAVAAACRGSREAAGLEPLLAQLAQQDDWRALAAALRRVLAGERDPAALLPGLDATGALIARSVLAELEPDGEPEGQEMTLDDLLALVGQACRPEAPPGLAAQLHGFTRQMAADPAAPAEIRALGHVLNAVLSGERDPDLSALPPGSAEAVRAMLAGE